MSWCQCRLFSTCSCVLVEYWTNTIHTNGEHCNVPLGSAIDNRRPHIYFGFSFNNSHSALTSVPPNTTTNDHRRHIVYFNIHNIGALFLPNFLFVVTLGAVHWYHYISGCVWISFISNLFLFSLFFFFVCNVRHSILIVIISIFVCVGDQQDGFNFIHLIHLLQCFHLCCPILMFENPIGFMFACIMIWPIKFTIATIEWKQI